MHASCAKKKYKAPLLAAAVVVRIYVCAVYVFRFNVWIQTLGVAGSRLGSVDPQFWTSFAARRLLRARLPYLRTSRSRHWSESHQPSRTERAGLELSPDFLVPPLV
jgi:hypothetical protein